MNIVILNSSDDPIYEQIKNQIKNAIINGNLNENELLPSIRQLAKMLKTSVITTTKAYSELEKEGFITSVPGKGFYVLKKNNKLIREQILREIEEKYLEILHLAKVLSIDKKELEEVLHNIGGENYE